MAAASFKSLLNTPRAVDSVDAASKAEAKFFNFAKTAKAEAAKPAAGDSFAMASDKKSLKSLEEGGVATSGEFRAPKFFRS